MQIFSQIAAIQDARGQVLTKRSPYTPDLPSTWSNLVGRRNAKTQLGLSEGSPILEVPSQDKNDFWTVRMHPSARNPMQE
jgi:hypothetical protein